MTKYRLGDISKFPIEINYNGKNYSGVYWIKDHCIYVMGYGPDGPIEQWNRSDPYHPNLTAGQLFRELVEAGRILPDEII